MMIQNYIRKTVGAGLLSPQMAMRVYYAYVAQRLVDNSAAFIHRGCLLALRLLLWERLSMSKPFQCRPDDLLYLSDGLFMNLTTPFS